MSGLLTWFVAFGALWLGGVVVPAASQLCNRNLTFAPGSAGAYSDLFNESRSWQPPTTPTTYDVLTVPAHTTLRVVGIGGGGSPARAQSIRIRGAVRLSHSAQLRLATNTTCPNFCGSGSCLNGGICSNDYRTFGDACDCSATLGWSGAQCALAPCTDNTTLANGGNGGYAPPFAYCSRVPQGSTCQFSCRAGFSVVGSARCGTGGVLAPHGCQPDPCAPLTTPPSRGSLGTCGALVASGLACNVECDPGYMRVGSPLLCTLGSFVGDAQECELIPTSTGGGGVTVEVLPLDVYFNANADILLRGAREMLDRVAALCVVPRRRVLAQTVTAFTVMGDAQEHSVVRVAFLPELTDLNSESSAAELRAVVQTAVTQAIGGMMILSPLLPLMMTPFQLYARTPVADLPITADVFPCADGTYGVNPATDCTAPDAPSGDDPRPPWPFILVGVGGAVLLLFLVLVGYMWARHPRTRPCPFARSANANANSASRPSSSASASASLAGATSSSNGSESVVVASSAGDCCGCCVGWCCCDGRGRAGSALALARPRNRTLDRVVQLELIDMDGNESTGGSVRGQSSTAAANANANANAGNSAVSGDKGGTGSTGYAYTYDANSFKRQHTLKRQGTRSMPSFVPPPSGPPKTLNAVLNNPDALRAFKTWLGREYKTESLAFWDAVEDYRVKKQTLEEAGLPAPGILVEMEPMAREIYSRFIDENSPHTVSLPDDVRNRLRTNMDKQFLDGEEVSMQLVLDDDPAGYPPPKTETLFDEAHKIVFDQMRGELFARFVKSQEYKDIL